MQILALFRPISHYFDRFLAEFPSRVSLANLRKTYGILETSAEEREKCTHAQDSNIYLDLRL